MLNIAQEVLDLLDLKMSWLEHVGRAVVVVYHRDGEYFKSHHVFEVSLRPVVFYCFFKLSDAVVIFIGKLPPIRTKLRNAVYFLSFQTLHKLRKLIVNFGQVF